MTGRPIDGLGYLTFRLASFLSPPFVTHIYPYVPFATAFLGEGALFRARNRPTDVGERGERYDFLFDIGANRPSADFERVLAPNGKLVLVGAPKRLWALMVLLLETLILRRTCRRLVSARVSQADLVALTELVDAGKLSPVIDRAYLLSEVPEAFRYFESGQVRGNVGVRVP